MHSKAEKTSKCRSTFVQFNFCQEGFVKRAKHGDMLIRYCRELAKHCNRILAHTKAIEIKYYHPLTYIRQYCIFIIY